MDIWKSGENLNSVEETQYGTNEKNNLKKIEPETIDVVVTNPPYKKIGTGVNAKNEIQQISRFETSATLDDWIKVSSKILKPNGSFYMVYSTESITEVFETLKKYR